MSDSRSIGRGCAATGVSSFACSTGCRSCQLPATNGSLKAAPLLARRALSLKQSQQPGSKKAASQPSAHAVLNNVPCHQLQFESYTELVRMQK